MFNTVSFFSILELNDVSIDVVSRVDYSNQLKLNRD